MTGKSFPAGKVCLGLTTVQEIFPSLGQLVGNDSLQGGKGFSSLGKVSLFWIGFPVWELFPYLGKVSLIGKGFPV